jgi:hypothetical protein
MAQHDMNIANQGFPATRTDINNALSALNSMHSGTSRPSGATTGTMWLDTTNSGSNSLIMKFFDGSDDITLATIDTSANTVNFSDSALASDVVINTSGAITTTGAFTSKGIDDNADATAITIDSSENVGIGTTSPSSIIHAETTTGAELILSRNDTSIAVDDLIGGIQFKANDASSSPDPQICGIKAISTGATNTNPKLNFFAGESNYNSNTPDMSIDSSGNVGIGTSSPSGKLDVNGSIYCDGLQVDGNVVIQQATGDVSLTLAANENASNREPSFNLKGYNSSSNPIINFGDNSGYPGKIEYENQDNSMRFYTNSSEAMRIDSSGNLLVNCTSTSKTSDGFRVESNGIPNVSRGSAGTFMQFYDKTSGSIIGTIQNAGGTSTTYNTTSDYRLKENVSYDFDATTRLKQLKPARFNFIADADTTVDGFLAHEVSDIVPEAITGTKDAVDENGNPEYQGIDQSKLVPLLVKTIQELEARITTLEANNP